ncbi:MAG: hypothetical protein QXS54_02430 [Candidatus Methanomethylicaceae archaeon]
MTGRVVSTQEALQAIDRMQQIINGGLVEQIEALNREGQRLSDPNVWDGRHAIEFRSQWPQTYQALMRAKNELEQVRANLQTVNRNIMAAGGNA